MSVLQMAVFDLFSKRQKMLRGEVPDVYQYDEIPTQLRVQIGLIIKDAIGKFSNHQKTEKMFQLIHDILCREYGIFSLQPLFSNGYYNDVINRSRQSAALKLRVSF
ncbi:MAG: hypothetical protein NHB32_13045 [Fischerella sp. CENA71]|nr:hypothetical protein [Fischerella sp. CENA71]